VVLARRLSTLESELDPEAMVLHWLIEAQGFPSLLEYLASLEDGSEPDPLVDIPDRPVAAAKARMKGQPSAQVDSVVRHDVRDAVFRFHLVFALDEEAGTLIEHEGLHLRQAGPGVTIR
jgi:hypothetical protein